MLSSDIRIEIIVCSRPFAFTEFQAGGSTKKILILPRKNTPQKFQWTSQTYTSEAIKYSSFLDGGAAFASTLLLWQAPTTTSNSQNTTAQLSCLVFPALTYLSLKYFLSIGPCSIYLVLINKFFRGYLPNMDKFVKQIFDDQPLVKFQFLILNIRTELHMLIDGIYWP